MGSFQTYFLWLWFALKYVTKVANSLSLGSSPTNISAQFSFIKAKCEMLHEITEEKNNQKELKKENIYL